MWTYLENSVLLQESTLHLQNTLREQLEEWQRVRTLESEVTYMYLQPWSLLSPEMSALEGRLCISSGHKALFSFLKGETAVSSEDAGT